MDIIRGATRLITGTATATTAAAGAVGGAAINGVIGGVQGTVKGIRDGADSGSHSTPAALLTLGAVGATGLVEWPVLLTVGGATLLIRQFVRGDGGQADAARSTAGSVSSASTRRTASATPKRRSAPAKSTRKATKSTPRKRAGSR
jgi:hypothetical protein